LGRTPTGWIAPAYGWRTHSNPDIWKNFQMSSSSLKSIRASTRRCANRADGPIPFSWVRPPRKSLISRSAPAWFGAEYLVYRSGIGSHVWGIHEWSLSPGISTGNIACIARVIGPGGEAPGRIGPIGPRSIFHPVFQRIYQGRRRRGGRWGRWGRSSPELRNRGGCFLEGDDLECEELTFGLNSALADDLDADLAQLTANAVQTVGQSVGSFRPLLRLTFGFTDFGIEFA
jgi:hypothetical protein